MPSIITYNYLPSSYGSCRFWHIWCQKYRDREIGIRGHWRSSKLVPFNRMVMVSY